MIQLSTLLIGALLALGIGYAAQLIGIGAVGLSFIYLLFGAIFLATTELTYLSVLLVFVVYGVLALIFWIFETKRPSLQDTLSPNHGPLSNVVEITDLEKIRTKFLASAGATFSIYVNPQLVDRTEILADVGNTRRIVEISPAVKLLFLPGGVSTPATTQLRIITQEKEVYNEIIDLETLPMQKWTHVAIVKEGRRFTVYYNGRVVASRRTLHYPILTTGSLLIGDPNIKGKYAYPTIVNVPLTQREVREQLAATSDTRHKPHVYANSGFYNSIWSNLPKVSGCPDGVFCSSTSGTPKTDPLTAWESSYA